MYEITSKDGQKFNILKYIVGFIDHPSRQMEG